MWRIIPRVILTLGISVGVGCGSSGPKTGGAPSPTNLKAISVAYMKATDKLGRPPAKLQELEPFLKELGSEDFLRSPEDGQEYVIVWRTDPNANPALVLAYEKEGKSGRRYVLWGNKVWYKTDEEIKTLKFAPGYKLPF